MTTSGIKSNRAVWPRRVWRYGPMLACLAFIFFASTDSFSASNSKIAVRSLLRWWFPQMDEPSIIFWHLLIRKAGHFTEYGVLAWLTARAFASSSREWLRRHWFGFALLLVAFYALSDEFHQSFVPTRTASLYDSLIDIAGGLTVLLLYRLTAKRSQV